MRGGPTGVRAVTARRRRRRRVMLLRATSLDSGYETMTTLEFECPETPAVPRSRPPAGMLHGKSTSSDTENSGPLEWINYAGIFPQENKCCRIYGPDGCDY